jgi:hypothetical protein
VFYHYSRDKNVLKNYSVQSNFHPNFNMNFNRNLADPKGRSGVYGKRNVGQWRSLEGSGVGGGLILRSSQAAVYKGRQSDILVEKRSTFKNFQIIGPYQRGTIFPKI